MAHRDKFGRTTFGRKWTRPDGAGETPAPLPINLPLRISRSAEAFGILDAADRGICYVYFEDEQTRRQTTRRFTEAEAHQIAQTIARMLTDADDQAAARATDRTIALDDLNSENDG